MAVSKNGRKLLKWLHKNPQEWYYSYQIRKSLGDYFDEVFMGEMCDAGYLNRTAPYEDEPRDEWDDPVFLYRIKDAGNAYVEGLLGSDYDRWSTRFFAFAGFILGLASVIMEIYFHFCQ